MEGDSFECSGKEEHETLPGGTSDNKNNERFYKSSQREEEDIDKLWIRELQGMVLRRRIIHDVWEAPNDGLGRRFERAIIRPLFGVDNRIGEEKERTGRRGQREIFIIGEHEGHLHVIHDCAYSGSTCRCLCIQRLREYTTEDSDETSPEETRWKNSQSTIIPEGEITLQEAEIREQRRRR